MNTPLADSQLMKPQGGQSYDYGLRWDEGVKGGALDVNKAHKIRFNPAKMRFKTHGANPGNDDQNT